MKHEKEEKREKEHMGKKSHKEHGGFGKKEPGFSSKVGKSHKMFGKEMSPAGK